MTKRQPRAQRGIITNKLSWIFIGGHKLKRNKEVGMQNILWAFMCVINSLPQNNQCREKKVEQGHF